MTENKEKVKKQTNNKTANPQKTVNKKSTNKTMPVKENKEDTGFFVDAAENIETGAKVVREKTTEVASDIAEKTSEVTNTVIDKVKDVVSDAVDIGTKTFDEVSDTAQNYINKYKNKLEMNKVSDERNKLTTKLGSIVYIRHKVRDVGPEHMFKDQEILTLIKDIEKKDKEIIKIGKKIESK
jgi:hypothetical protein